VTSAGELGVDTAGAAAPTRERRCELLAAAAPSDLVELAERCLDDGSQPTVLAGPEVGVIALQVREPIAAERFYVGEVLVTQAEVAVGDGRGWAMRMGGDRVATLAAAVLDAEVEAGRPRAREVLDLCRATERRLRADETREWDELAATEVHFEELD
jgi:alpha-D-ribose 1-methylphosphonate 5-triphosphate synthase subunit PhnG